MESIEVSGVVPVSPSDLFEAWLNGEAHADMTGAEASSDPRVGGRFTAWGGYIEGTTLELEPPRRIVQAWRTSAFPADAPDSRLEMRFEAAEGGTRLTFVHTHIPDGQGADYQQGWVDHYLTPMSRFYGQRD